MSRAAAAGCLSGCAFTRAPGSCWANSYSMVVGGTARVMTCWAAGLLLTLLVSFVGGSWPCREASSLTSNLSFVLCQLC